MSSISIIIIEKTGQIREQSIKSFDENELYKKAGFKTSDGFKCHTVWNIDQLNQQSYSISVYGKTNGRANQENKYDFPPPIDSTLFFGNCILVNKCNNLPSNISCKEWNSIYEHLFGGFEDINNDDSNESEEDCDSDIELNKFGYEKDGFVIDEDEEEDDDYDDDEEEDIIKNKKKKSKVKSKSLLGTKKSSKTTVPVIPIIDNDFIIDNLLGCTNELTEENYI